MKKYPYHLRYVLLTVLLTVGVMLPERQCMAQDSGQEQYETFVSSLFGRRALHHDRIEDASTQALELEFWIDTLAFDCGTKDCTKIKRSDESMWRIMGLATQGRSQAVMRLLEVYATNGSVAQSDFMEDDIEALFEDTTLTSSERIHVYAALIPLLKKYAIQSNDQVRLKKLQAAEATFEAHGISMQQRLECMYVVDEAKTLWIRFPLSEWAFKKEFVPETGTMLTPSQTEVSLFCRVDDGITFAGSQPTAQELHQAIDVLHQAVASRDQDAIDMAGNGLLMALGQAREEFGWAVALNPSWRDEDLKALECKIHTVMIQLLAQDRLVLASRLDAAMQTLFPQTRFYDRLRQTASCFSKLKGSYRTLLRSEYDAYASAYEWVLTHFEPKKRPKIEKAFASWTKRAKPMVGKVRRAVASFTALSLGDRALAGKFSKDVTKGLARATNPQVYGYDLAMKYVRGEVLDDNALTAQLDALYQKSAAHMFDTLTFARQFMEKEKRQQAVSVATAFQAAPAPKAAAIFSATYMEELSSSLSHETFIRFSIWTIDHARYVWRGVEREKFARQIATRCLENGDVACVRHVSDRFLADPLTTDSERMYWEKQKKQVFSNQKL